MKNKLKTYNKKHPKNIKENNRHIQKLEMDIDIIKTNLRKITNAYHAQGIKEEIDRQRVAPLKIKKILKKSIRKQIQIINTKIKETRKKAQQIN